MGGTSSMHSSVTALQVVGVESSRHLIGWPGGEKRRLWRIGHAVLCISRKHWAEWERGILGFSSACRHGFGDRGITIHHASLGTLESKDSATPNSRVPPERA